MSGLTPDFGTGQQSGSATFANPTAPNYAVSTVANGVANALPQGMWQGNPIRNFLGVPAYAASGSATSPTQSVLGTQNYSPANASYGPPPSNGGNNGASTGGSSGNGAPAPGQNGYVNPNTIPGTQAYIQAQQQAAAQQAAANITAATNQYNNLRAQLETQRPVLDSAYQTGLGDLNNQLQLGQQQGQANSAQLTSAYNAGMGTMGQQYQDSQAQNRELARAMGGNGSDYAQLQNRTNNSYQNNMFQSSNDYQSRLTQINQGLQSLQQWGATQQHSLATQYQQGINQLVLNEDMTDFSKAQAIQQIQSDYSKQLANINSVVAQFGNQLSLAKAQVDTTAAMFGKQIQGYDPLSNMAQMFYGSMGTPAPTVDASGGISYPNKTAGGINNNQGAASF